MADKITTYNRSYHQSDESDSIIRYFPSWMELTNRKSTGFQLVNALYGQYGEKSNNDIEITKDNFHVDTSDTNEYSVIYKTIHNTASGSIPQDIAITTPEITTELQSIPSGLLYITSTTPWTIINADSEESFLTAPPTRLAYNPSNDIKLTVDGTLTGITFVKDWIKTDASGIVLIPKQDVYIVNQNLPTPVANTNKSTIVYSTSWNILDSYDYGLGYQDYDHAGYYEVVTDPSGYIMKYNPISNTLRVFDYLNVDASGNAQLINTGWDTTETTTDYITSTTFAISGTNPYNLDDISKSNYFLAYQYKKMTYPNHLTTNSNKWNVQKYNGYPIFTTDPTNYNGTIIPHSRAMSASGNQVYLRTDPRDLRPGHSGDIRFTYVDYYDTTWNNDVATSVDLDIVGTNYYDLSSSGVHIYSTAGDITREFPVYATGNIVYIGNNRDIGESTPYTIRTYYNARKTYSGIVATQSFSSVSGGIDPYPQDYMIKDDYIIPYSILPITESNDAVRTALLAATGDQFILTTQLLFTGVAYDKDKDCVWMLESNNMMLYKLRPTDGAVLNKYAIFKPPGFYFGGYKSMVNARPDIYLGDTKPLPFISYDKDNSNRTGDGMIYYKDFLYILASGTTVGIVDDDQEWPVGGYGIYRLNTYSDVMDIEYGTDHKEKWPHYPLPISGSISSVYHMVGSGTTDITIDDDENFMILDGNIVKKLTPHYDYTLIDSSEGMVRGTVYYREKYTNGITIPTYEFASE